jgi:hypothetical protein
MRRVTLEIVEPSTAAREGVVIKDPGRVALGVFQQVTGVGRGEIEPPTFRFSGDFRPGQPRKKTR